MGAWIETVVEKSENEARGSHPVWVRGLKLFVVNIVFKFVKSHPVWVRGLKHHTRHNKCNEKCVAPRVGAWIETKHTSYWRKKAFVAPRVGAWIETSQAGSYI